MSCHCLCVVLRPNVKGICTGVAERSVPIVSESGEIIAYATMCLPCYKVTSKDARYQ